MWSFWVWKMLHICSSHLVDISFMSRHVASGMAAGATKHSRNLACGGRAFTENVWTGWCSGDTRQFLRDSKSNDRVPHPILSMYDIFYILVYHTIQLAAMHWSYGGVYLEDKHIPSQEGFWSFKPSWNMIFLCLVAGIPDRRLPFLEGVDGYTIQGKLPRVTA